MRLGIIGNNLLICWGVGGKCHLCLLYRRLSKCSHPTSTLLASLLNVLATFLWAQGSQGRVPELLALLWLSFFTRFRSLLFSLEGPASVSGGGKAIA